MVDEFFKKLAKIISFLFTPILMPTYSIIISYLFCQGCYKILKYNISLLLFLTFILTACIPLLNLFILFKMNRFKSWDFLNRKERYLPFLINIIYYGILSYGFIYYLKFSFLSLTVVIIFISLLLAYLITLFYKISIHALGIGVLIGNFIGLDFFYDTFFFLLLYFFFPIIFLVFMARLKLKAHSFFEIFWGLILGLTISISIIIMFLSP